MSIPLSSGGNNGSSPLGGPIAYKALRQGATFSIFGGVTAPTIADFITTFTTTVSSLMTTVNGILVPSTGITPVSALIWIGLLFGPLAGVIGVLQRMTRFGRGGRRG